MSNSCDSVDCSLPGSSVLGISQARRLEWVAISFSYGSFWLRDRSCISYVAGRFFTTEPYRTLLLFSCSVVSNSLRPPGLKHARLPCPSPSPGVCSNSCPLSWWCHPSRPLLSPSPAFNLFQHQGLFQLVVSSHQVAKVLNT